MKRVATLLLVLGVAALARATDRPPPGPVREGPPKVVPVTTVVDALEDVSDYAFFEVWRAPADAPSNWPRERATLHFFQPSSAAHASRTGRGTSTLYAVPRAAVEHIAGWKEFAADGAKGGPLKHTDAPSQEEAWFKLADAIRKGDVPGAASVPFVLNETDTVTDGRQATFRHYRITRTATGLAFVKVVIPPATDAGETVGKCGNEGPSDPSEQIASLSCAIPRPWLAVGGLCFLAVTLAGAVLMWQLRKPV